MKLLSEKTSLDGTVQAKIYEDGETFYTEYYVNGALQREFNSPENTTLAEVVMFAEQWVGSVRQLNG